MALIYLPKPSRRIVFSVMAHNVRDTLSDVMNSRIGNLFSSLQLGLRSRVTALVGFKPGFFPLVPVGNLGTRPYPFEPKSCNSTPLDHQRKQNYIMFEGWNFLRSLRHQKIPRCSPFCFYCSFIKKNCGKNYSFQKMEKMYYFLRSLELLTSTVHFRDLFGDCDN